MKNTAFAAVILFIIASPAYASHLGAQSFPSVDFTDDTVTLAEMDLAETEFSNPGLLPDSPFYFLKRITENVRLLFTFDPEDKAKLHLDFAKTRLVEAKALIARNKTAVDAINEYNKELETFGNISKGIGTNVSALARESEDSLEKSSLVLSLVLEKAPQQAKPALEQALNNSIEKKVMARIKSEMQNETSNETQDRAETEKEIEEKIEEAIRNETKRNERIREEIRAQTEKTGKPEEKKQAICIQVITPARSSQGECKEFATPCAVPEGWERVQACELPAKNTAAKEPVSAVPANQGISPAETPVQAPTQKGNTLPVQVNIPSVASGGPL